MYTHAENTLTFTQDRTHRVHIATRGHTFLHTQAHTAWALPVRNEEGAVIRMGVKDVGPETWTSCGDPRVPLRGQCAEPYCAHTPEPALPRRRRDQARALGG